MKRFLITTADERTWKFDRPVIFLGEWCCRHNRKHIWQAMDGIVAKPYGIESKEKLECFDELKVVTADILLELTAALNNIHGTNHTERYWNLLLGHWLQRYIKIIINRYYTLVQAIENYEIRDTICIKAEEYSLIRNDMLDFSKAISSDLWNHMTYSYILNHFDGLCIEIHHIKLEDDNYKRSFPPDLSTPSNSLMKGFIEKFSKAILSKLRKDTDALIVNSYLPKKEEIKLHLSLGQVPQLTNKNTFLPAVVDREIRGKLNFNTNRYSGLNYHIRNLIPEMLPTCYLEGRKKLIENVNNIDWPSEPKFIFTSNNFAADEVFKLWTATKVEEGTPYFVGQHGANYGTMYGCEIWPELTTCDRFLSWGWDNSFYANFKNIIPAFNFKVAGFKKKCFDKSGSLILIERGPGSRDGPQDRHYEHILLQKDVFSFFDELVEIAKDKTIVRLHHGSKYHGASDEVIWKEHSPRTQLDLGDRDIWDLIKESRIVVYTYDSAGILENMALNIPTICFWRGGLEHLLPGAKPYYELLRSVDILADTPKAAAKHISNYWHDIGSWWDRDDVQEARKIFCERYSVHSTRPIRTLKSLLLDAALN
ncbi:MAG: hypothetical protein HND53_01150 [Proteobacteria bacterium]|nr:hypothetical protein [Pseudomonadota bacterium]NOG59079.1 hypothetical protein [Pseudomonadota bacterium]